MDVIFKYQWPNHEFGGPDTNATISMPKSAKVLHFALQNGWPCLWVNINNHDTEISERKFELVGTGHSHAHQTSQYLGTVLMHDDALVLHAFEVK